MGARIGIIGGSGFTGAELLRLLAAHPQIDVAWATGDSKAGMRVAELYPSLAATYGDLTFQPFDEGDVAGLDLVFVALPHGHSQSIIPQEMLERLREAGTDAAGWRRWG